MFIRSEPLKGISEFGFFREIHDTFKVPNENWLLEQFKNKETKDDKKAEVLRVEGNSYFKKEKFIDALSYYTRSLCHANRNSANYGLALANRSAALFKLGDFENCLRDIEFCLKSEYPRKLYPKVLLRKCSCIYRQKGESDELKQCIEWSLNFIINCDEILPKEKDMYEKQFKQLDFKTIPEPPQHLTVNDYEIPSVTNGENKNVAFASSLIELKYEESKGRHVVAKDNIKRGDVLFVEKAFISAPLMKEKSSEQLVDKCYGCFKDTRASIPCTTCTVCIFCDENCFQYSWQSFHKWECLGMQANLWYKLGIAFPAFRAICKGKASTFAEIKSNEIAQFGNKEDNYPYFNSLLSHWTYNKFIVDTAIQASKIVLYLKKYTNFFDDVPSKIDVNYIGGLLIRHIGQIVCNASTIVHWDLNNMSEIIPNTSVDVGSGIFPSLSLMNHSCKPNIYITYVGNIVIVKATTEISKSEEIFNCYSANYLERDRNYRQSMCKEGYNFTCTCVVCSNPEQEIQSKPNLYKCPHCASPCFSLEICTVCKKSLKTITILIKKNLRSLVDLSISNKKFSLNSVLKNQEALQRVLTEKHPYYQKLYEVLWKHYFEAGDPNNTVKYLKLLAERRVNVFNDFRLAGKILLTVLQEFYAYAEKKNDKLLLLQDKINSLKEECVFLLQLELPFSHDALYRCISMYTMQNQFIRA